MVKVVFYLQLKTFPFHLANPLISLILAGIKDFQRKGKSLVSQDDHKTLGSRLPLMSSREMHSISVSELYWKH